MSTSSVRTTKSSKSTSSKTVPPKVTRAMRRAQARAAKASRPVDMTATPLILKPEKTDEHLELYETLLKRITPALVDRMSSEVRALPGNEIDVGIPANVYVSEAAALACLAEWHMSPRPPVMVSLVAQKKRLGAEVCVELVYLTEKIRELETLLSQGKAASAEKLMARGTALMRRMRRALDVIVDDGVTDEKDVAVEALRREHELPPTSQLALIDALKAYCGTCRTLAPELGELEGFDMAIVDEATKIAGALLSHTVGVQPQGLNKLRKERNSMLALMRDRVAKLRKVMAFVFDEHPEVVRATASEYGRNRRRASAKAKAKAATLPKDKGEPKPSPEPDLDPTEEDMDDTDA